MKLADRMYDLGTETAFEVLAKAKELESRGVDVIHLEIGEPDFDTPEHIKEAAIQALREGYTHYSPSSGIIELKDEIARNLSLSRGIQFNADEIVVTPGAKPILFFTILACVNPGDEVIYPDPGFPIYESVVKFVGAKPVPVHLLESNDFSLDMEELVSKISDRTRLIILNSPHNPTGGILTSEDLAFLSEALMNRDCLVLSDEVYSRIVYDSPHESIVSFPGMKEKTILLDGFSKTYAMTGWRLGYAAAPKAIADAISKLMVNSNSCTATFVQRAGIEALSGSQKPCIEMVEEFRKRRDLIVAGLNSIDGISCRTPRGAFYVFPNITKTGFTSEELAASLLKETGVAVLAGTCFGRHGAGYLRLSFANSRENISRALERIATFLKVARTASA
ncbi:MAG TPA: pyridoxal phosphate-dependent aminotransferase [Clostridia bacterium]|nr:pyridoxal phosphate-dependent aminotransferase [Clostridia bacterium]